MAGPPILTLPTPGGSLDVWGTLLNASLNALNDNDRFARKTADESVTSNITPQNDDHLLVPVDAASAVYLVDWSLRVDGATAGDFRYAFTAPAGATMIWESIGLDAADVTNVAPRLVDVPLIGTNVIHGTLGAGVPSRIHGSGLLLMSTTAGNLQLQWAQGTSSVTATRALTGSWLQARRKA